MSEPSGSATMDSGERRLLELGYKQELRRGIATFANFAFTFNFVAILSAITVIFPVGWFYGGPVSLVWGWCTGGFFATLVALSLAEICSAYPTSGGMYYWSFKMAESGGAKIAAFWAWMTAWVTALGQWSLLAVVGFSLSQYTAMLLYVGTDAAYVAPRRATVGFAIAYLATQGLVSCLDVRLIAYLENFCMFWNIGGLLFFIIGLPLASKSHQSAKFVFTNFRPNHAEFPNGAGIENNGYLVLIGLLYASFSIFGFDAAAHMAEETKRADKVAPRGIINACLLCVVCGLGYTLALLFCIKDPDALGDPSHPTGGYIVAQIIYDVFYERFQSKSAVLAILSIHMVAFYISGVAIVTATSRTLFAFARDGGLPFSRFFRTVVPGIKAPLPAIGLCVVAPACLMLTALGSQVAFTAICSMSTSALYLAYGLPIVMRWVYAQKSFKPGPFYLGSFFSPLVSFAAVMWVAFISVVFAIPTYYPVTRDNLNYSGIGVGGILVLSLITWVVYAHRTFRGPVPTVDAATNKAIPRDGQTVYV